jgi:hypothetical protein
MPGEPLITKQFFISSRGLGAVASSLHQIDAGEKEDEAYYKRDNGVGLAKADTPDAQKSEGSDNDADNAQDGKDGA